MGMGFEDFSVDQTLLDAGGLQKVVTKDLIWDLEPMLVAVQFLAVDTKMVGQAGKTREFRKSAAYDDAEDFLEGADVPTSITPARSTVDVTPTLFGTSETITGDAIDASDFDEIRLVQQALALSMARRSDARIWNAIFNPTPYADVINGAAPTVQYALTAGKLKNGEVLLEVTDVQVAAVPQTAGVDYYVDMYLGEIEFVVAPPIGVGNVTVDYITTDSPNSNDAITAGELQFKDLVRAKNPVKAARGKADLSCFHHDEVNDLEADDKFTDADRYGGQQVLLNGEIGKLSGVKILTSDRMYSGVGYIAQSGPRLGYFVWKKRPVAKAVELEKKAGDVLLKSWQKDGVGILDRFMGTVVTNMQYYAKKLP